MERENGLINQRLSRGLPITAGFTTGLAFLADAIIANVQHKEIHIFLSQAGFFKAFRCTAALFTTFRTSVKTSAQSAIAAPAQPREEMQPGLRLPA